MPGDADFRFWPESAIGVLQSYVRFREPPHWRGTAVMGAKRTSARRKSNFGFCAGFRTSREVRLEFVMRTKADVCQLRLIYEFTPW